MSPAPLTDVLRDGADRHGHDLSDVTDAQLLARVHQLPAWAADDVDLTCLYLRYGARDDRAVRAAMAEAA